MGAESFLTLQIADFAEGVDDRVAALLTAGTGITLTYNDGAGTLTIASTVSPTWGSIGGTLSSQTDLQTALNAKMGGSTGATDNRILRADGTGGSTVQNSAVTIDDSGNISGLGTISGSGVATIGGVTVGDSANTVPTIRTSVSTTGFGFEGQYGSAINFIHGGTRYYQATDAGFQVADSVPIRFRVLGSTTRGEIWGTSSSQIDVRANSGLRVRTLDGSAAAPIDASSLTFGSGCRLQGDAGFASLSPTANRNFLLASGGVQLWNEGSFRSFIDWSTLGTVRFTDGSTGRVGIDCGAITASGGIATTGTLVNVFDANSGLWVSGGILLRFGGGGVFVHNGSGAMVRSSDFIGWSSSTLSSAAQMAGWFCDATDVTAQRRGTNAQTSRLYNTFSSSTNGEWLQTQWASNQARIGTAVGSAGGTQRNTVLGVWNSSNTWTAALAVNTTGTITCQNGFELASRTKAAVLASSTAVNSGRFQLSDAGLIGREVYPDGTNWRYASDDSIVT